MKITKKIETVSKIKIFFSVSKCLIKYYFDQTTLFSLLIKSDKKSKTSNL